MFAKENFLYMSVFKRNILSCDRTHLFLGAFAKLRKATISIAMSVRPSIQDN
jgi:DNA-binding MurR/RpiR family transcriptional regulator